MTAGSMAGRTVGVRSMPDGLDSGYCHLRDGNEGVVRVNLDGIWTVLCAKHRRQLMAELRKPAPLKEDS